MPLLEYRSLFESVDALIAGGPAIANGQTIAAAPGGAANVTGVAAAANVLVSVATPAGDGVIVGSSATAQTNAPTGSFSTGASLAGAASIGASLAVAPDNVVGGPLDVTITGNAALGMTAAIGGSVAGEIIEIGSAGGSGSIVINFPPRKKAAPLPYQKEPAIHAVLEGREGNVLAFASPGGVAGSAWQKVGPAIARMSASPGDTQSDAFITGSSAFATAPQVSGGVDHGEKVRPEKVARTTEALHVLFEPLHVVSGLGGTKPLRVDLEKRRRLQLKLNRPALVGRRMPALKKKIAAFLDREGIRLAKDIAAQYSEITKAAGDGIVIRLDWTALAKDVKDDLKQIYKAGGARSFADVGGTGPFDQLNARAESYARNRAAAMVGKKEVDGKLVDNPDAKWAIDETTRTNLRSMVDRAFDEGMTPTELRQAIEDLGDFSESRAEMIAETELANAQNAGAIEGWRESGVVSGKSWLLSNDHADEDECDDNADAGVIDLDDTFPSGDDTAPAHPHCYCDVVAEVDLAVEAA